jgi:Xaa-Pro aminopeptidase
MRAAILLLSLVSIASASPADERRDRIGRVARELGEGTLLLPARAHHGYRDQSPEPNLFWLTGLENGPAVLLVRVEYPDATERAKRARVLADRMEDVEVALRAAEYRGSRMRANEVTEPARAARRDAGAARRTATAIYEAGRGNARVTVRAYLPAPNPARERWSGPGPRVEFGERHLLGRLRTDLGGLLGPDERVFVIDRDDLPRDVAALLDSREDLFVRNPRRVFGRARAVKSAAEIARIRKACELTAAGLRDCMRQAAPGQFEYELQAILEYACRKGGARRQAFRSIVGSGPNGTILHYDRNRRRTEDGELVLMDVGAEYRGYAADVTRTFPVNGRFTKRQAEIYDVVLAAQRAGIAAVKPGATMRDVDRAARDVIRKAGFGKAFLHSVGHWVGLEVHDPTPVAALEPGVVLTVEPGIYLPGQKIGIRIEDTVVVTKDGCDVLSKDVPKERAAIERLMAEGKR